MTRKNSEIVLEYFEQAVNAHQFDKIHDYFDRKCVSHERPYVGIGLRFSDRPGGTIVITSVAANGPAFGRLQVGDEIVRVQTPQWTREAAE